MSPEFLLISLLIVLTPGTGMIYTLACALTRGWRAALLGALGGTLSIVPHIAAAVFGLAAVLHASAVAFQFVKYLGVAYLLFLAWKIWRDRTEIRIDETLPSRSHLKIVVHGILASLLNPKLSVFFLAFLPQFIAADAARPVAKMIGLGAVFMAMTFVAFAIIGTAAALARSQIAARPSLVAWLRRALAGSFVLLGLRLALAER